MRIFNYSRFIVLCQVVILSEAFVQTRWRGRAHLEINQPKKELVLHSSRSVEDLRVNAASALLGLQLVFGVGLPFTSTPINVPIARAGEEAVSSRDATADEAWRLLDKFYLDKNFNGQDWAKVREEASARARKEGSQSAIQAMTSGLGDKYTRYVDAKSYEALSRFDLIGAGVLFAPDDDGQMIIASPPMGGSSALAIGLKKGDFVTAINGQSTKGMSSFDVIDLMMEEDNNGNPNLKLKVQKPGQNEEKEISLKRKILALADPVTFKLLDGTHTGYIRLSEFNARCAVRVREAVVELEKQGAERYILDLRGNPGGTFQTAAKIAGIFMEVKMVCLSTALSLTWQKLPSFFCLAHLISALTLFFF